MNAMKILSAGVLVFLAAAAPLVQSQPAPLSLEEAVRLALLNDPSVESANWDWLAASAKADAADLRKLPSFTLAAGYQRLSELPASSFDMPNPFAAGTISFSLPASLTNIYTTAVNLQYPVFSGFRIRETAALARLQTENRQLALEMVKRSLVFEVRRAYWETVRARDNVQTLQKNLEFLNTNQKLIAGQAALGTATQADLLTAEMRSQQAEIDLGDGESMQRRTSLVLASLIGENDPGQPTGLPLTLATQPGDAAIAVPGEALDEGELIAQALSHRAEVLIGSISIQMAERNVKIAKASLLPTVALTGNLTLADPNPRVAFQTDPGLFVGTWSLGVQMSYDLGGFPSNRLESLAQSRILEKSRADLLKQQKAIALDVRTCLLNLERARRDLALIRGMVQQAEENVRVVHLRYTAGSANNLDVLSAELALLRANFAVTNRQIDAQIAAADLARAAAMDELR
jgi:outer membrane protein TolC